MFDYKKLITYVLEGLAVAVSAFFILGTNKSSNYQILLIALTASAVFAILDNFAPKISFGTRRGTGFGIGWNLVGGGDNETEKSEESFKSENYGIYNE